MTNLTTRVANIPAHDYRRIAALAALGVLLFSLAWICLGLSAFAALYVYYSQDLPPSPRLDVQQLSQSVKIFDRTGALLYEVTDPEGGRRTLVQPTQIPTVMKQAVIATEDPSFYSNWGVDGRGVLRAIYYQLRYGRTIGGSTITQQLVKNLFLNPEPSVERKIREAFLALEITRRYPKEQVLAAYLNAIYFGNLAYGIQAASQSYFNKDVSQLNLAEASLLAGLPQAPSLYDPCDNPGAALARQKTVLSLMTQAGYVGTTESNAAASEMENRVRAPEFKKRCRVQPTFKAPHFVMYVRQQLEEQFGPEALYHGGFQVTTSLDPRLQAIAEQEAKQQIASLQTKNVSNAAVLILNPQTGEILAMVGSVDFFDDAIAGQVNVDYDGKYHGLVSARNALASSLNIPAVKTLYFTSTPDQNNFPQPLAMLYTARSLGITTFSDVQGRPRQPYGLALTLGGGEVRLLELTSAYATFSNQGARIPPTPYLKIVDAKGRVVYDSGGKDKPKPQCARFEPNSPDEEPGANGLCASSAPFAYLITSILSDDDARAVGFGRNGVLKLSRPAAVKTGTTDDFRDNWTIGYTPDLVVGVWVGNADNSPMRNVSGISGAAPIWHNVMERALAETPAHDFSVPRGILQAEICIDSGLLATPLCPRARHRVEFFCLRACADRTRYGLAARPMQPRSVLADFCRACSRCR